MNGDGNSTGQKPSDEKRAARIKNGVRFNIAATTCAEIMRGALSMPRLCVFSTNGAPADGLAPGDSAYSLAVSLLFARQCLRSRVVLGETA